MHNINRFANRVGAVLGLVCLAIGTGCIGYVERPYHRAAYIPPPPPVVAPPVAYVAPPPPPQVQVQVSPGPVALEIRSESDFYEPLTPYGRWEVVGSYGRCWIPGRVDRIGALMLTDNGNGLTPAGTGPAMSHGPGQRIITGDGIFIRSWAGIGCHRRSGPQPGCHGMRARDIMAGLRCILPPGFRPEDQSPLILRCWRLALSFS